MPVSERYQVDIFAVVVLIFTIILLIFLVVTAIYFMNLMNSKPPTISESTFLFGTSIVLTLIFLGIAIYALIRLFTYTVIVCDEPRRLPLVVQPVAPTITVQPVAQPPVPLAGVPAITVLPSNVSQNVSDVPLTQPQQVALGQELTNISVAMA